jgi:hypothetical protein
LRRQQRVADGGEPVGAAPAGADLGGERGGARLVRDARPVDRHHLLVAIRPLEHEDVDSAFGAAADGGDERRAFEGAGDALVLQLVFLRVDTLRHIDGEHQREIDRLGSRWCSCQQRQQDSKRGAADERH